MDKKHSVKPERQPPKLNSFWRAAFLAAEIPITLRMGPKVKPAGLAHLAAEYADAAVSEYRRRFG